MILNQQCFSQLSFTLTSVVACSNDKEDLLDSAICSSSEALDSEDTAAAAGSTSAQQNSTLDDQNAYFAMKLQLSKLSFACLLEADVAFIKSI